MNSEITASDLDRIGTQWLDKISQAEKREDDWIKDAEKAESAYTADKSDKDLPSFNILHSNVETIVPSIFNSSPTPDLRPRHGNNDPIAKTVADIIERSIMTQVDDNEMDQEVEKSAQDAFMAGRGVVRIRFDADEIPAQVATAQVLDSETGEIYEQEVEVAPARVVNERILFENVSWRDYREGPAKRWRDVPWVAYRHEVTEYERERLENPEYPRDDDEKAKDETKDCTIWEIWCKETEKVYFVVDETGTVLDIKDDPLGLTGFFPQAAPVQPITATGKRCPVCPYSIYVKLAEELDTATRRINKIMGGLRVRGVIAGNSELAELMAELGDNELMPVANLENLAATGGLDKAVMWWPVDQAIAVLQQLYAQREQTKQAIYEITGISDIIRGQGTASETATAQQIKTEWGALRVKKMQRLVERQVRDLFKITAELISLHFSMETVQKIAGMQIDPQAAQFLQKPLDHYRIDVESDSTVRADLTKQRTEMSQFLQGTAEFFATMAPVVQSAPAAAGPLAKMYAAFARQFSLGKSAEDALDEFVKLAEESAKQPKPNPEAEARKAEMELKMKELQGKMGLEVEKLKLQAQNLGLDKQLKQVELQLKRGELGLKGQQLQLDEAVAEVDAASRFAEIEMEQEQERPVRVGN